MSLIRGTVTRRMRLFVAIQAIVFPVVFGYEYAWSQRSHFECVSSKRLYLGIGTYGSTSDTEVSRDECKTKCAKDSRCLGFNFQRSCGFKHLKSKCHYLTKSASYSLVPNENQACLFYLRPGVVPPTAPEPTYPPPTTTVEPTTTQPTTTQPTTVATTKFPTTIPATSSKMRWMKVREAWETKLLCTKLNKGKNHHPRYETRYATVEQCQDACLKLVKNCDAVNYDKGKGGKCGFEQCNGHLSYGGTKGSDSYIFARADAEHTIMPQHPCPDGYKFTSQDLLSEDVHNHARVSKASRRKCHSLCNARVGCRGFESNGITCQTIAGSPSKPLVGSKPQGRGWTSCLKDHVTHPTHPTHMLHHSCPDGYTYTAQDLLDENVHNHAHTTMANRRKCGSLCDGRVGCRGFESNGKECQTLAGSPSTPLVGSKPQGHAWTSCLKDHKKHGHLKDHKKHGHPTATTQGCGAFGCCYGTSLVKRDREGSNCPVPTREEITRMPRTRPREEITRMPRTRPRKKATTQGCGPFGCCYGTSFLKRDKAGSNCPFPNREETTRMPRRAFRTRPPRMPETTRPPRTAIPTRPPRTRDDFPTTRPTRPREDFPTTLPPRTREDFPTPRPRRPRPRTRDHFQRTRDHFQEPTTTAAHDGGLADWIKEGVGILKGSIFDDDDGIVVVHGRKLRGVPSDS